MSCGGNDEETFAIYFNGTAFFIRFRIIALCIFNVLRCTFCYTQQIFHIDRIAVDFIHLIRLSYLTESTFVLFILSTQL